MFACPTCRQFKDAFTNGTYQRRATDKTALRASTFPDRATGLLLAAGIALDEASSECLAYCNKLSPDAAAAALAEVLFSDGLHE